MSRVAIIGAGPSGLAQLHAFAEARRRGVDVPEAVCFEKQSDWGGLWNYSWRTGLDDHGDPVHASMYHNLWSVAPKECLELSDYTFDDHFGQPIPSYPPRAALYDYITGRAKQDNIRRQIRFDTVVRQVTFDPSDRTFHISIDDLAQGRASTEKYDHVIVATGHFSTPNLPDYPGLASFPGRIMHSHDFRDATEFTGKDVLVVGGSFSAEDITLQTLKYGARSVSLAYRDAPMGFDWPVGITEVPALTHLNGRTAHFSDQTTREVDAIVLCTGYQHHFPFLEESLRLRTTNSLYPVGLYKGVVWIDNPQLLYLGMQNQLYTFTMFDAQARLARDVILGGVTLPQPADMTATTATWIKRLEMIKTLMDRVDFQTDYLRDLGDDRSNCSLDLVRRHWATWIHQKQESITHYRNQAFISAYTGTQAPAPHTPWWEQTDGSLATFLNSNQHKQQATVPERA